MSAPPALPGPPAAGPPDPSGDVQFTFQPRAVQTLTLALVLVVLLAHSPARAAIRSHWSPEGTDPGVAWDPAYTATTNYFETGQLKYHIITQGTFAVPSNEFIRAIDHAFQTWEDVTNATIGFVRGEDLVSTNDEPIRFTLGFSDGSGNTQWGVNMGSAVGLSSWSYYDRGFTYTFSDTDIALDSGTAWTTDGSDGSDVENVALHEIGHSIGLGHSPDSQAEMSYVGGWFGTGDGQGSGDGNIAGRRPASDDILGVTSIYPTPGYSTQCGTITGTISAGSTNMHLAHIGLYTTNGILVGTTASRLGIFRFDMVPPGEYVLRAYPSPAANDYIHQAASTLSSEMRALTAASTFLALAANDVTGVVVSAGTTITQNLSVANGATAIAAQYSTYYASGWEGRTQVLRIPRGGACRVGLYGTNLPANVGENAEWSIGGDGITIDAMYYSGQGWSVNRATDITIAADATPGGRPLFVRNTNFPNERYMVFGYIEVVATGATVLARTPTAATASPVGTGETQVAACAFTLTPDAQDRVRLRALTFSLTGTNNPVAVAGVALYRDANANATLDMPDVLVSTGALSGSSCTLYPIETLSAATTTAYIAALALDGTQTNGETFVLNLAATNIRASGWYAVLPTHLNPVVVTGTTLAASTPPAEPTTNSLLVISAHASPTPPQGTTFHNTGTQLTANVNTPALLPGNTTQYVCTGWIGSGSVPPAGPSNTLTFTITNDSSITWTWATNYWLDTAAGPGGTVTPADAWYAAGSNALVTATPSNGYRFTGWNGTIDGWRNPTNIAMGQAHALTAQFAIDGPVPDWWHGQGVLQTNAIATNDYAACNAGQLKWIASCAYNAMSNRLGTAGDVPGDAPHTNTFAQTVAAFSPSNNYAVVNLGQVKCIARPCYDWLIREGLTNQYPWSNASTTNDYGAANIGQVKNLFSFDL